MGGQEFNATFCCCKESIDNQPVGPDRPATVGPNQVQCARDSMTDSFHFGRCPGGAIIFLLKNIAIRQDNIEDAHAHHVLCTRQVPLTEIESIRGQDESRERLQWNRMGRYIPKKITT